MTQGRSKKSRRARQKTPSVAWPLRDVRKLVQKHSNPMKQSHNSDRFRQLSQISRNGQLDMHMIDMNLLTSRYVDNYIQIK